jgi:sulfur carrier protein
MNIKLNGEALIIDDDVSLYDFVLQRSNNSEPKGVAVALNETIIPKSKWKDTVVNENDAVEIVHAVQGG